MESNVKRYIRIETHSKDEALEIAKGIHNQLVGNPDYIDSNIVLNYDHEPCVVQLWVFEECKNFPKINI